MLLDEHDHPRETFPEDHLGPRPGIAHTTTQVARRSRLSRDGQTG